MDKKIRINGGGFLGNKVTSQKESFTINSKPYQTFEISTNFVKAKQVVDPKTLRIMEKYYNTLEGGGMKHEVCESYCGAKMSQQTGYSAPNSFIDKDFYEKAHNASAIQQPGDVYQDEKSKRYFLYYEGKERLYLD